MLAAATSLPSAPSAVCHRERELLVSSASARAAHRHRRFAGRDHAQRTRQRVERRPRRGDTCAMRGLTRLPGDRLANHVDVIAQPSGLPLGALDRAALRANDAGGCTREPRIAGGRRFRQRRLPRLAAAARQPHADMPPFHRGCSRMASACAYVLSSATVGPDAMTDRSSPTTSDTASVSTAPSGRCRELAALDGGQMLADGVQLVMSALCAISVRAVAAYPPA